MLWKLDAIRHAEALEELGWTNRARKALRHALSRRLFHRSRR